MKQSTIWWIVGGIFATGSIVGLIGWKKGWFKKGDTINAAPQMTDLLDKWTTEVQGWIVQIKAGKWKDSNGNLLAGDELIKAAVYQWHKTHKDKLANYGLAGYSINQLYDLGISFNSILK